MDLVALHRSIWSHRSASNIFFQTYLNKNEAHDEQFTSLLVICFEFIAICILSTMCWVCHYILFLYVLRVALERMVWAGHTHDTLINWFATATLNICIFTYSSKRDLTIYTCSFYMLNIFLLERHSHSLLFYICVHIRRYLSYS